MRAIILGEQLFRSPETARRKRQRGQLLATGAGSRQKVRRHADADGAPARQSVSAPCVDGRRLLGLGALSRQRPCGGAEYGERAGASCRRDLDRDRDFSHPRAEPSLYRPDPTFSGRIDRCSRFSARPRRRRRPRVRRAMRVTCRLSLRILAAALKRAAIHDTAAPATSRAMKAWPTAGLAGEPWPTNCGA